MIRSVSFGIIGTPGDVCLKALIFTRRHRTDSAREVIREG